MRAAHESSAKGTNTRAREASSRESRGASSGTHRRGVKAPPESTTQAKKAPPKGRKEARTETARTETARTETRRAQAKAKAPPPSSRIPKSSRNPPAPSAQRDPLLSAICHDLRAPLAAVTMGANFVLQTSPDDESGARSRRVLEAILRSCKHMERLIRNFADLSEIEAGTIELRLGLHDAGEILAQTREGLLEEAAARSVAIELATPAEHVLFACDRERFARALRNIVENAVRVAPSGSAVTLGVRAVDDDVVFDVTDRGPGLSPPVKRNLFDRQWHAKRADRVGTGFGLAIARGFAVAHGGALSAVSEPDIATTFTLVVPANRSAAPDSVRLLARN